MISTKFAQSSSVNKGRASLTLLIILLSTLGGVTLLLFTGGSSSIAAAATCGNAGTYNYHAGGITNPNPVTWGGKATFPERRFTVADIYTDGFVVSTLWNTFPSGHWLEIGFSRGWHSQDIYTFYYATDRPTYGYFEARITKTPGGTGTSHVYYIYPSSVPNSQVWLAQLDSNTTVSINMLTNDSTLDLQVGGEMTSSNSIMESTTFSLLQYYEGRNKTNATNWPNSSNTFCQVRAPMNWDWVPNVR